MLHATLHRSHSHSLSPAESKCSASTRTTPAAEAGSAPWNAGLPGWPGRPGRVRSEPPPGEWAVLRRLCRKERRGDVGWKPGPDGDSLLPSRGAEPLLVLPGARGGGDPVSPGSHVRGGL